MKKKLPVRLSWDDCTAAKIHTSAAQLIGRTPLLELTNLEKAYGRKCDVP